MEFTVFIQPFTLLVARLSPFFMAVNGSPMQYFPMMVRLVLLLIIAGILTLSSSWTSETWQTFSNLNWGINMLYEMVLGMLMLLGFQLAIAAIQIMGRVLDMQIGFAAAGVVDPHTNNNDPLLGHIIILFVVLAMFLTNTHHKLLISFSEMVSLIPPGSWNGELQISKIMSYFSAQLGFALLLLGPVIMGLWLMDLFSGLVSKTMPQMNVYFVTLPLKIWLGMYLLSLSVKYFKPLLGKIFFAVDAWIQAGWIQTGGIGVTGVVR